VRLGFVALAAFAGVASCSRCGSSPQPSASPSASASASAPAPSASAAAPDLPELPEVKDTGTGRATAALRAALAAYGIPFDAAELEKACEVDEDGASIDDLEDVANDKYGLEAAQIILPREHVLLAEPRTVPGIVIVEGADDPDTLDFVLVWKIDGDRVLVMDPVQGKGWVPRADLQRRIDVHEMVLPAEDWHAAEATPRFQEALRVRLVAAGLERDKAQALVDRAAADPASRALGALEAAARQLEADPAKAGGDARAFAAKAVDCALDAACADPPVPASFWSARPAPRSADGQAQVTVRGAVMLAIEGRKPPAP